MIERKQARDSVSNNECWHCKKTIDDRKEATYYIWANPPTSEITLLRSISIKIKFHKSCFEEIAGEQYMFESY
jgi:hypothetical protein